MTNFPRPSLDPSFPSPLSSNRITVKTRRTKGKMKEASSRPRELDYVSSRFSLNLDSIFVDMVIIIITIIWKFSNIFRTDP